MDERAPCQTQRSTPSARLVKRARCVGPTEALMGYGIVSTGAAVVSGCSFRPIPASSRRAARQHAHPCTNSRTGIGGLVSVVSTLRRRIAHIAKRIRKLARGKGIYKSCSACVAAPLCLAARCRLEFISTLALCASCKTYLIKTGPVQFRALGIKCHPLLLTDFTKRTLVYGSCPACDQGTVTCLGKVFTIYESRYKV